MTKEQYKREDFNIYDVIIFEDLNTSIEQACVNEIKKEKEVNEMVYVVECDLYAISLYENGYKVWKRGSVTSPFYATDLKIIEVINLKQVKQALTELKAIKESKPSEALECLEKLPYTSQGYGNWKEYYTTIKQSLLKTQVQEKVLEVVFKKYLHIGLFEVCNDLERYNYNCLEEEELTQEEFKLLKKWVEVINGK